MGSHSLSRLMPLWQPAKVPVHYRPIFYIVIYAIWRINCLLDCLTQPRTTCDTGRLFTVNVGLRTGKQFSSNVEPLLIN